MGMNVKVVGKDEYDDYSQTIEIEEYENDSNRVLLNLDSGKGIFRKDELLRAVRIMCEE